MCKTGIGIDETTTATDTYMLINILSDFFLQDFHFEVKECCVFQKTLS